MPKYDVFISFKNTDDNGLPTKDSAMAESLYFSLQKKGYNPFFSKYSIESVGRSDYMTLINDAIESAKVFVAVGTSRKNLTSRWVKREISMFSALMMQADEGDLTLLTYRSPEFPVGELPANLADLQSFADENALIRFIAASLNADSCFRSDTTLLSVNTPPVYAPVEDNIDSPLKIEIGHKLDNRYLIISKIGQGGMSNVYLALNEFTKKQYAIKEIRSNSVFDFNSVSASLLAETNMMKKLFHPGIPQIIDTIETKNSFITVMEYVEGVPLDKVLENTTLLPEKDIIDIAKQMASVLKYLHSQSLPIIHRDIKPANIMLQPDGYVKLLDFGTAREYKKGAPGDTINLGTIGYAAPEQYGGMGQTDGRTDIYGLGVTLYYLATGNDPSKPPYEILPIRDINPGLSKELEYIIQKCTQKDPDSRYQSASELLYDLEHFNKLTKHSAFSLDFVKKIRRPRSKNTDKKTTPLSEQSIPVQNSGIVDNPILVLSDKVDLDRLNFKTTSETTILFSDAPELLNNNDTIETALSKFSSLDPQLQKIIIDLINHLADKTGTE